MLVQEADRWTYRSDSTTSFVPDLGMQAGKAILAVGKAEISIVKKMWTIYRRRAISSKFPHSDNANIKDLDEMYDDLIEFAR